MSAIKHALSDAAKGVENAGKSLGKDLHGAGKAVGSAVAASPSEIGGHASTPLGAGINALAHKSLTNIRDGLGGDLQKLGVGKKVTNNV